MKCTNLTDVSLPSTLTKIDTSAFEGCTGLTEIKIPKSVKTIGKEAFKDCTSLSGLVINSCGLTTLGESAFENCKSLLYGYIPITVTEIGEYAFRDCTGLKMVAIDKNLETVAIEKHVFDGCSPSFIHYAYLSLGEIFTTEDGLYYKVIYAAFDGTGEVALVGKDMYKANNLVIPAMAEINGTKYKVTRAAANAFAYEDYLDTVVLGSNVAVIEDFAFRGCNNLKSVTGGANLLTIGKEAFASNKSLKTFKITSAKLKKIGNYAFSGDKSLKTLYLKKTTKLTKSGVKKSLKGSKVKTVKVKKSKVKKYKKIFKKSNSGRKVKVKK